MNTERQTSDNNAFSIAYEIAKVCIVTKNLLSDPDIYLILFDALHSYHLIAY